MTIQGIKLNHYIISTKGRLYSISRNRLARPTYNSDGYLQCNLMSIENKLKTCKMHRLVMMQFRPFINMHLYEVNHINGKKDDNDIANLEWCTRGQNIHHSFLLGSQNINGSNNPNAKLTLEDVIKIRKLYNEGYTPKEIATMLGVDNTDKPAMSRIRCVINNKTWKIDNI